MNRLAKIKTGMDIILAASIPANASFNPVTVADAIPKVKAQYAGEKGCAPNQLVSLIPSNI